jgi:cell division control protein 11
MDIELMRRLSPRVNVIPVIGKADTLTPSELKGFKKRVSKLFLRVGISLRNVKIMQDIEYYDIPVYNFPYDVEEDDEETIQDNSELRVRVHIRRCPNTARTHRIFDIGYVAVRGHWL